MRTSQEPVSQVKRTNSPQQPMAVRRTTQRKEDQENPVLLRRRSESSESGPVLLQTRLHQLIRGEPEPRGPTAAQKPQLRNSQAEDGRLAHKHQDRTLDHRPRLGDNEEVNGWRWRRRRAEGASMATSSTWTSHKYTSRKSQACPTMEGEQRSAASHDLASTVI